MSRIPDWQLPPGVDRGAWDYTHNPHLAREYDASLAGSPLLRVDVDYCREVFQTPGHLIDLGCGTGRLAIDFARKGFACTAVDLSEEFLAIVREKATQADVPIETIAANLVELDHLPANQWDYAACLFSTFGMLRGKQNRLRFLRHVARIVKPGGVFVVHAHNRIYHHYRLVGWPWMVKDWFRSLRGRELGEYPMPQLRGGADLTLKHFSLSELQEELSSGGWESQNCSAISATGDIISSEKKAYGFLIKAVNTKT